MKMSLSQLGLLLALLLLTVAEPLAQTKVASRAGEQPRSQADTDTHQPTIIFEFPSGHLRPLVRIAMNVGYACSASQFLVHSPIFLTHSTGSFYGVASF